jgi:hypothetical protein
MLSSTSFLYTCTVIIQTIIIQNNHVKKHNTMFFLMSMLCNRIKSASGINNNDDVLVTIGEP